MLPSGCGGRGEPRGERVLLKARRDAREQVIAIAAKHSPVDIRVIPCRHSHRRVLAPRASKRSSGLLAKAPAPAPPLSRGACCWWVSACAWDEGGCADENRVAEPARGLRGAVGSRGAEHPHGVRG